MAHILLEGMRFCLMSIPLDSIGKTVRTSMPTLTNPRHEAFCHAYAVCGNAAESWRRAGGRGANGNVLGSRWLAKVGISERIAELRAAAAAACEKSRKDITRWLAEVIEGKRDVSGPQIKAVELLNRMNGWNEPEKVSVTPSSEERAAHFQELLQSPAFLDATLSYVIPAALKSEEGRQSLFAMIDEHE